jgi:hypothetical protein
MPGRLAGWIAATLVAVSVAGGCARIEEHSREQSFQEDIAEYGRMIRWGFYEAALDYIRPAPSAGETASRSCEHKGGPGYPRRRE